MASHPSDDELRRYAQRQSPSPELWTADQHLRECEQCRARVRQFADVRHLDFDTQIVPYVDGTLSEEVRRDVEAHLAFCEVCRREVDDLRPLAARRGSRRGVIIGLAAAASLIVAVSALLRTRPQQTVSPPPPRPSTVVQKETPLAVSLRDGKNVVGVDASGAVRGVTVDARIAARIAEALSHPQLAVPAALSAVIAHNGELRGAPADHDLAVVSPAGVATLDTRPRLTWRGNSPATYHVSLFDESMHQWSGETQTTEWTPPLDLPRGRMYTWQVATTIDGHRVIAPAPPEPEARFRVVDEKTADAVEAARRDGRGHLVTGILCYDAGAIAEARHEFEQLAAENPSSPIPRQWIESCERVLRR